MRSRVPAVYPTIQLFFHAGLASIEVALLALLITSYARPRGITTVFPLWFAVGYSLLLAIWEILGLTSSSRKIPRPGGWSALLELIALGLYAVGFFFLLVEWVEIQAQPNSMPKDWRYVYALFILTLVAWPMHLLFLILACIDCGRTHRRNPEGQQESHPPEIRQVYS